jgi:hypothetical protein
MQRRAFFSLSHDAHLLLTVQANIKLRLLALFSRPRP